jgi:ribosomal-protein-alanine N-acetyltransferase
MYPDKFLVYVEESSDKILGYIIFRPGGHIVSIAVDLPYRRRGIGTKLIKEVLKVSYGNAMVEVRVSNKIAQMFYKKLGFIGSGSIPGFYENEDAIVVIHRGRMKIA